LIIHETSSDSVLSTVDIRLNADSILYPAVNIHIRISTWKALLFSLINTNFVEGKK